MATPPSASSQIEQKTDESGSLVLVSHCLLNQCTRAGQSVTTGVTPALLDVLARSGAQVYQLPCPEYRFLGFREKRTQDAWEAIPGFAAFVEDLADRYAKILSPLLGTRAAFLIGIARSPCCSLSQVHRGEHVVSGKGLWVKQLQQHLALVPLEFDYKRVGDSLRALEQVLTKKVSPP